ncbi:MAG: hypothetical protein WAU88_11490 [Candidatus Zixiibacteriota bacterium]
MANKLYRGSAKVGARWQGYFKPLLPGLIALAVYLYRSWGLKGWIIDDAGISFAYARDLAMGYGLVSQPGMPPVEGFSNLLWVGLLSPFFRIGLFDPYVTPKVIAAILVLASFYLIHRTLTESLRTSWLISQSVLIAIALSTSFVVWTCSGLENPLLCFLVALLMHALVCEPNSRKAIRGGVGIGMTITALAITRPDGVMYGLVLPILLVAAIFTDKQSRRPRLIQLGLSTTTFLVTFGAVALFKHLYFGTWFPNTYTVKGGPTLDLAIGVVTLDPASLLKLRLLLASIWGESLWLLIAAIVVPALVVGAIRLRSRTFLLVPGLLCCLAIATHLLLPDDWMREFRFATPFFMMVFVCAGLVLGWIAELVGSFGRFLVWALAAGMIWITWTVQEPRLMEFEKWPTVSFGRIAEEYGTRYDGFANELKIDQPSVLIPDIGATLYYSKCRVYDLGGLCDPTIAHTRQIDQLKFWDYVFDTMKPTFIHTHGFFSAVSKFERDPRFSRDYVGLNAGREFYAGDSVLMGDWVRRDQIAGKDSLVAQIRAAGR